MEDHRGHRHNKHGWIWPQFAQDPRYNFRIHITRDLPSMLCCCCWKHLWLLVLPLTIVPLGSIKVMAQEQFSTEMSCGATCGLSMVLNFSARRASLIPVSDLHAMARQWPMTVVSGAAATWTITLTPDKYARYDVEDNPTIPGNTSGLCETFMDYTSDFRAGLTKWVSKKWVDGVSTRGSFSSSLLVIMPRQPLVRRKRVWFAPLRLGMYLGAIFNWVLDVTLSIIGQTQRLVGAWHPTLCGMVW